MTMIEIKAVVRPSRLDMLRAALKKLPSFPGMTVAKVEGCSSSSTRHSSESGTIKQDLLDFSPKVMIHIVVEEPHAQAIYDAIIAATRTSRNGDGLVWMTRVEQCLFIAGAE